MIPLHVHSYYSLLKGTIPVEKLINRAKQLGLKSIALTDTNGMHGLIKFAKLAKENNIKPIIGTLIDLPNEPEKYVILLAKNNDGYSDLCRIITSRKLNDDFSLKRLLQKKLQNLFIITPCTDLLSSFEKANSVYIELISTEKEKRNNKSRYEFATKKNIGCVVTNPIYFLDSADYVVHKVVSSIRLNTNLENLQTEDLVDEEFYFKKIKSIESKWKKLKKELDASDEIAAQCNVNLNLNEYKFPKYELSENTNAENFLRELAYSGLAKKYNPVTEKITKRLNDELTIITEMNFTEYFLVVWDIVNEAKRRGMMIIGRGSAANSIVAYCLGLTQVDPIELNLYFERFMNKARSSVPDVDIDFSWKERDEIVRYIFEKYGYENTAMICTTVTFRARSAFREVAKTFGFTNEEISKYSKRIPWSDAANLPNLAELFPESKKLNFKTELWLTIVNIASRIARYPRHLSIHPGGIVITPKPITNYVALEYAKNKGLGLIVTQPDMYSIEDMGLIKIDILSQRSLGVLRDTMESIDKQ